MLMEKTNIVKPTIEGFQKDGIPRFCFLGLINMNNVNQ
jgi:phosphoribosylamine--glycine ligase